MGGLYPWSSQKHIRTTPPRCLSDAAPIAIAFRSFYVACGCATWSLFEFCDAAVPWSDDCGGKWREVARALGAPTLAPFHSHNDDDDDDDDDSLQ